MHYVRVHLREISYVLFVDSGLVREPANTRIVYSCSFGRMFVMVCCFDAAESRLLVHLCVVVFATNEHSLTQTHSYWLF